MKTQPKDPYAIVMQNRALLGTDVDHVIADKLGVTKELVGLVRRSLGIEAKREHPGHAERNAKIVSDYLERGVTISDLAKQHGLTRQRVDQVLTKNGVGPADRFARKATKQKLVMSVKDRLGKALDTVIARELGTSHSYVNKVRMSLGIPRACRLKVVDEAQRSRILKARASGESLAAIGRREWPDSQYPTQKAWNFIHAYGNGKQNEA